MQPTISITFSSIYQEVADYLGYGRSVTGDNLAEVKRYANDGYSRFLLGLDPRTGRGYAWSFMSPTAEIVLWSDTTGTTGLTLAGTTDGAGNSATSIGMSADTFHASMVGHDMNFDAGSYTIHSYTSGKSATMIGSATGETAGFSIDSTGAFTMPDNFGYLQDSLRYSPSGSLVAMTERTPQALRTMQSSGSGNGTPQYFAMQPVSFDSNYGQRWEMLAWPTPSSDSTLTYRYAVNPDLMSSDNEYPLGGALHGRTIRACALACAEAAKNDGQTYQQNQADMLIVASIDMDARTKPRNLGENSDNSDSFPQWERRGIVTY